MASAILDACSQGAWDRAETLFDADPQSAIEYKDRQEWTLLHQAINSKAPLSFVYKLLAFGSDPNKRNSARRTPLHYALQESVSPDLLEMLLKAGADPNAADKLGKTPVHWAVLEDVPSGIVDILVRNGGDPNRKDMEGNTPLQSAVGEPNAHLTMVEALLRNGADPNIRNINGKSALHLAILAGQSAELIRKLIECEADVNRPDAEGASPLYLAVYASAPPTVLKLLLESGAVIEGRRFVVARFHGNPILCEQIEKARILTSLCAATMVRRIGKKSYFRVMSADLVHLLSDMLYRPFSDALLVDEDTQLGEEGENEE